MCDAERFSALLDRYFAPLRKLSSEQVAQLFAHYRLLVRWNKVLNLTAIRDLEEVVVRHYCESLFIGLELPGEPVSLLDVGSGAGFPGIPLAVLRPDCRVTLAESHQRKAVFLREASREYSNLRVQPRRAEEIREAFDWVVSRAVRWQAVLRRADRTVALLLGEDDARAAAASPGFAWRPALPLRWGRRRVLLIGERINQRSGEL